MKFIKMYLKNHIFQRFLNKRLYLHETIGTSDKNRWYTS